VTLTLGMCGGLILPLEGTFALAERAERGGYGSLVFPDGESADALLTIAAVGPHTGRILLGTGVTDVIRHDPVALAHQTLVLDHLTRGRFFLGLGMGKAEVLRPYGYPLDRRASRLEEALRIIRLLWESEGPVHFDGRFWKIDGAVCELEPYHPGRYPPIWIGARGPRMLRIVGELADGWLPPMMSLESYVERMASIDVAARAADRDPASITRGLMPVVTAAREHDECHRVLSHPLVKLMIMLPTPDEVYRQLGHTHPLGRGFKGFDYEPAAFGAAELERQLAAVPEDVTYSASLSIHGTPEEIAARIAEYAAIGCEHMVLTDITPIADAEQAATSATLLDELVASAATERIP
jgi:phthiodiolone/phenolphthiodiolone dimycocerosates ketoreductase